MRSRVTTPRRRARARQAVVERFLALAARMRQGPHAAALRAYRELLRWPKDDKEELIFRLRGAQPFEAGARGAPSYGEEKRCFIRVNNAAVCARFARRAPHNVLLLLPFCLQHRSCPHQIAWQIENCAGCGRCAIAGLRQFAREGGMKLRVAVRAAFAPGFVKESRPDLVLAVACEDELLAGILRIAPRACYGFLNVRPEGPCKNTQVDLRRLKAETADLLNHPQRVER